MPRLSIIDANPMSASKYSKFVFPTAEVTHYRFPTHVNDLILDRADAETSEAFLVRLEPGEAPPLHVHDDAEQVFYVIGGRGRLHIGEGEPRRFPVAPADLVRIPPGVWHQILCEGDEPLVYLSVDCFVKGRPEDEPTWESHAQAMCARNGWDISKVRKL
jgi:mannose-6-phosphate isomerase-like protein (cupin superfamily)